MESGEGGGRSLVNQETALALLIGQPLGGWSRQNSAGRKREVKQTSFPLVSGANVMQSATRSDMLNHSQ